MLEKYYGLMMHLHQESSHLLLLQLSVNRKYSSFHTHFFYVDQSNHHCQPVVEPPVALMHTKIVWHALSCLDHCYDWPVMSHIPKQALQHSHSTLEEAERMLNMKFLGLNYCIYCSGLHVYLAGLDQKCLSPCQRNTGWRHLSKNH